MDPDENLRELRELAQQLVDADESTIESIDVVRMADLIRDLDGWLSRGGFLPKRWAKR